MSQLALAAAPSVRVRNAGRSAHDTAVGPVSGTARARHEKASDLPVLRRRLGRRLRSMREAAGLTLDEAASQLDKTRGALHRIETGETKADVHVVRSMMDLYDTFDPEVIELVRAARLPGWWTRYRLRHPRYVGLEADATSCFCLALTRVPELVQTEGYARAVLAVTGEDATHGEDEIAALAIRQRRLTDPDRPLRLTVLLDEAALRREVGGPEVMRTQLTHLIDCAVRDSVTLYVLPDDLGYHEGLTGAFTVLDFPDAEDPPVLYVPYVTGARLIDKPAKVTEVREMFGRLCSVALSAADSVAFLQRQIVRWSS